jgi:hypothetical protein
MSRETIAVNVGIAWRYEHVDQPTRRGGACRDFEAHLAEVGDFVSHRKHLAGEFDGETCRLPTGSLWKQNGVTWHRVG